MSAFAIGLPGGFYFCGTALRESGALPDDGTLYHLAIDMNALWGHPRTVARARYLLTGEGLPPPAREWQLTPDVDGFMDAAPEGWR